MAEDGGRSPKLQSSLETPQLPSRRAPGLSLLAGEPWGAGAVAPAPALSFLSLHSSHRPPSGLPQESVGCSLGPWHTHYMAYESAWVGKGVASESRPIQAEEQHPTRPREGRHPSGCSHLPAPSPSPGTIQKGAGCQDTGLLEGPELCW